MKPKDLKPPFRWSNRFVCLSGGVLYVPPRCDTTQFTLDSWRKIFNNDWPVQVEYCSGHGHWIVERALASPQINWVAVECRLDRVKKIWSKRENAQCKNLLIVCGEAMAVTQEYFPSDSISAAYINFPDPWPKNRHAKHRLVQPPFLSELARVLRQDAVLTLMTDDAPYASRFAQLAEGGGEFSAASSDATAEWGDSFFRDLWRKEGRTIHVVKYARRYYMSSEATWS